MLSISSLTLLPFICINLLVIESQSFQISVLGKRHFKSYSMMEQENYGKERIQLITDIDDTVKSSGGVRLFWKVYSIYIFDFYTWKE